MSEKLLSICIPTYNRAEILKVFLEKLHLELKTVNTDEVEVVVSDNCSTDHTESVVLQKIKEGMPINYIKNSKNLGMDGNFVQCFRKAISKYVWVLGDDDFLIEDSLRFLMNQLRNKDYGLVHLKIYPKENQQTQEYCDQAEIFLSDISYWITFISANIVATKFVPKIDFEKYIGTFFTLIPLYMTSALNSKKNLLVNRRLFEDAADPGSNGGYNYFQVFIVNYLSIRKDILKNTKNSFYYYEREKYLLFKNFLIPAIIRFYYIKDIGRFSIENGLSTIFKYYAKYPYFYYLLSKKIVQGILKKMVKSVN